MPPEIVAEAAKPTSLLTAPVVDATIPPVGVGAAEDQERFNAIVAKVTKNAAKESVAERQAALAEADEAEAAPAEEPVEAEEAPGEAAAEPEESAGEPAETAATEKTGKEVAKIKALLAADPAAAVDELEKVLGKDALKALKLDSKQWAAFRHEKKQLRGELDEREAQLEQIHARLTDFHASLQPFAAARAAFDEGDYAKAHELAFGVDVNEFQKRALKQKAGEDPKVARIERELAEERRLRAEEAAQKQQIEQARRMQEQEAAYLVEIADEISTIDDTGLAAAAKIPGFAEQVMEIQRSNFDRRTRTTLPTVTAAEEALAKFREAYERWTPVFAALDRSDNSEKPTDRAEPAKAATKAPAKSAAKPKKSLTQSSATEAAGRGKALTPDEIYQKHLREMERAAVEEAAQELA